MNKCLFTTALFFISICLFAQKADSVINEFANLECSKYHNLSEKEWSYAKFVFSKINPQFYDLDRINQEKDSASCAWFDKVYTRGEGNNYSLDFEKIQKEAAKVQASDIPEIKEFDFIGMKMPLLEKAKTITAIEFEGCPIEIMNDLTKKVEALKSSYEVLVELKNNDEINLIMKEKDADSFNELIIFDMDENTSANLLRLKGSFEISDITPPNEYKE